MDRQKMTWGSHLPLNRAILKAFNPVALELGAGHHSTPIFFENSDKSVTVETDKSWIENVRKSVDVNDDHLLLHHDTGKVTRQTRRKAVSPEFLAGAREYYLKLHEKHKFDFVFIDCISSLRYEALDTFHGLVPFITFHDYQNPGINNHYNGGFRHDAENYSMFIDKTYKVWTGLLIDNTRIKSVDELKRQHAEEVETHTPGYKANLQYGNN